MPPDPPFSGTGNDMVLPIVPATYVADVEGNFSKARDEIIDLDTRVKNALGPAAGFNPFAEPGQVEVNGLFEVHRYMQEVSRTVTLPVDGNAGKNADYSNLASGAGLGITGGGTYTYHPTLCPGWFIPRQLLPAGAVFNAFGRIPATGSERGLQLDIQAAARLFGVNDEAVIFQPVSVHTPREKWAGRQITIELEYELSVPDGCRLYTAWDNAGLRVVTLDTAALPSTAALTTNRKTLTVTVPSTATMFEFGLRFESAAAMTVVLRKFIASSNPTRTLDTVTPNFLDPSEILVRRHYCQHMRSQQGIDGPSNGGPFVAGDTVRQYTTFDPAWCSQLPSATFALGRWGPNANAAVYAQPLLVFNLTGLGAPWQEVTDGITVSLLSLTRDSGIAANVFTDTRGTVNFAAQVQAILSGTTGFENQPLPWYINYEAEWLSCYKPLLLP